MSDNSSARSAVVNLFVENICHGAQKSNCMKYKGHNVKNMIEPRATNPSKVGKTASDMTKISPYDFPSFTCYNLASTKFPLNLTNIK